MNHKVDRLNHSFGVAEVLLELTGDPELYYLGLLHDIGYLVDPDNHAEAGGQFLKAQGFKYWREVSSHGTLTPGHSSSELDMLNLADLLVNSKGDRVSIESRLLDVKGRHGATSAVYLEFSALAKKIQNKYALLIENYHCT